MFKKRRSGFKFNFFKKKPRENSAMNNSLRKFPRPRIKIPLIGRKKVGILILCLLVFISLFMINRFFSVSQIQVNETVCSSQNQLKSALKLDHQNIFLIDTKKAKSIALNKFACVKDLSILKKFPSTLVINLTVRTGVLRLNVLNSSLELGQALSLLRDQEASGSPREVIATSEARIVKTLDFLPDEYSSSFLVDSDGYVLSLFAGEQVPEISGDFAQLKIGQKMDSRIVIESLEILQRLNSLNIQIVRAQLIKGSYLLIETDYPEQKSSSMKLVFALNGEYLRELASLQLILQASRIDSRSIESVDLRFTNPVVKYSK